MLASLMTQLGILVFTILALSSSQNLSFENDFGPATGWHSVRYLLDWLQPLQYKGVEGQPLNFDRM